MYEILKFIAPFFIILIIVGITELASKWCIFNKAGEKGYKALIPFYRDYIYSKITFGKGIFSLFYIIPTIIIAVPSFLMSFMWVADVKIPFLSQILGKYMSTYHNSATYIFGFITLVYTIIQFYFLAIVFNKSTTYGIVMAGCVLLCGIISAVLYLNIAFGSSVYTKGKDLNIDDLSDKDNTSQKVKDLYLDEFK